MTAYCRCPVCLVLDLQFPGAYQLSLFPSARPEGKTPTPRVDKHIIRRR